MNEAHGATLERLRELTCIKWTHFEPDVLPAWVADMDLAPVPSAVEAVRAVVERGDFGYNMAALRRIPGAFTEWQRHRHGWAPGVDRIRVMCDVVQAIEAALWLHTEPGDGVVVFTPIYPPFLSAVRSNGRHVLECPLDPGTGRLDTELLERVVDDSTRAVLLCNPHNPTGRVFSREELEAVLSVARDRDLLVISDEIWADLTYPGATHVPFASLSPEAEALTVTVTAASKAFNLAGLRCAVMHVGHEGVERGLCELPSHLLGAVGTPGAEATLAAWTIGEEWLDRTRALLMSQRDHLVRRLAEELPRARFSVPEATYLLWVDLRDYDLDAEPAEYLLEHARVALSPGPDFGERGAGFVRINFATSREILDAVVDRMVGALEAS